MPKENRKWKLYAIAIIVVVAVAAMVTISYQTPKVQPQNGPSSFEVNGRVYKITAYASTPQQQEKGLMNATVTNNTFMLFYFGKLGVYPFWMKDTYTQLDMIWLNYSNSTGVGSVVYIANATPCASYNPSQNDCAIYTPTAYANYVIEAKAGFVQQNNISIGTQVKLLSK